MTSPGLIDIVHHLHQLESSFGRIIVEAAVKLSNLTDSNIFVLIESQTGRKIAGANHLCDAYASGSLLPTTNDSRFYVDAGSSLSESPVETPLEKRLTDAESAGNNFNRLDSYASGSSVNDRKRRSPEPDVHTATKSSRIANALTPVLQKPEIKKEINDDDCLVISDDETDSVWTSDPSRVVDSVNGATHWMLPTVDTTPNATRLPNLDIQGEAVDWRSGGNALHLPSDQTILLPDSLRQKMRGLASVDTLNLLSKHTAEYRLFASTVYDFGKLLHRYAPEPKDVKDAYVLVFIAQSVDVFLKLFPFLTDCEARDLKICGLTITGFVRDRVKGGFKKLMRSSV